MPRFDLLTIFPAFFGSPGSPDSSPPDPPHGILGHGVLRRALATGLVSVQVHDLRLFASDRHRTVDDRPFGGGEGMVLKPGPIADAVASLGVAPPTSRPQRESVILLSASGKPFTQAVATRLATLDRIVLICGRYEGVDERVAACIADQELSIGDYVLSGGELGAAVVLDAVARLVPGVLGNAASSQFESFGPAELAGGWQQEGSPPRATHGTGGLLDYPHYTRPAVWEGQAVPEVLTGGDHEEVRRWRRERSLEKTWRHRPDLIEAAARAGQLSMSDQAFLQQLRNPAKEQG